MMQCNACVAAVADCHVISHQRPLTPKGEISHEEMRGYNGKLRATIGVNHFHGVLNCQLFVTCHY